MHLYFLSVSYDYAGFLGMAPRPPSCLPMRDLQCDQYMIDWVPVDIGLQRLIRFLSRDGRTYYGDAILPAGVGDIAKAKQARIVTGDVFGKHDVTDQIAVINATQWLATEKDSNL